MTKKYVKHEHNWHDNSFVAGVKQAICLTCGLQTHETENEKSLSFIWERSLSVTAQIALQTALIIANENIPDTASIEYDTNRNQWGDTIDYVELRARWEK